jgi:hypothetical protein
MKAGDLVRFNDVSSFADCGEGSFTRFNGVTAIVVLCWVRDDGAERVKVLMQGEIQKWHPSYFKEVLNANR